VKFNECNRCSGPTEEAPLKQALRILAVLMFALSLSAQPQTGLVQGKIVDKDGKPLAAVKVTLSRPQAADLKAKTGPSGIFRFPSVFPGADYTVRAELADFKTASRSNVTVRIGGSSTVDLVLEAGKPEEQTVYASAFPTIDLKRVARRSEFGRTELQILPTARDPWEILRLIPAVMLDRENVGGSESTEPASVVAMGDASNGANNVWILDGVDVSDPSDLGQSTISFDFDAVDTISVTTGGADTTIPTSGITVNLLNSRGGNKTGGAARFYLTDKAFQASNITPEIKSQGVANTNRIEQIKDYGVNVGGPIFKNRIWWWGSYGVQDIYNYTIYNIKDQALISNYSLKLDAHAFAGNRFEALYMASSRARYGTNSSPAAPEGYTQSGRYSLGNPIFKLQDEQTIGNDFYLSLKFFANKTGTNIRPAVDEDLLNPVVMDVANGNYVPFTEAYGRSWDSSSVLQSRKEFQLSASLFRDSLFGASHEFRAGLGVSDRAGTSQAGVFQNFEVLRNFVDPLIDLGEGMVAPPADYQYIRIGRDSRDRPRLNHASFYLQDTISKRRFTMTLGLRYDRQAPSTDAYTITAVLPYSDSWKAVFGSEAMGAVDSSLPALSVNAIDAKYRWSNWSPRLGLSWDVKGDGRTVVKLSLAQYGDLMSAGAHTIKPLGLGGGVNFWWKDTDGNGLVGVEEMLWQYSSVHPDTPGQLYAVFTKDAELSEEAYDMLEGGFESDAYIAGNYQGYDFWDPEKINYDNITTLYRSDIDPEAKNIKTSPRTREIAVSLERELRPNLTASVAATFRRYDNFDWAKLFYPADIYPSTPDLVIDNTQDWYVSAGTVPSKITVEEDGEVVKEYDLGDAAGKPWYLPNASFPGETPYRLVDKSSSFRTYLGLDLSVTKRLSHRWFMNASITLQDQRVHWGGSYIDPTNKWAIDGQPYGNWSSGVGGKVSVQMYARWMTKISALYQMPLGISVSATILAREGWKIPNYVTLAYADQESWPGLYGSNLVYLQTTTKDHLPVFHNVSFRIEKSIRLGSGKMVLMADIFNLLNSAIVNRAYDAYIGTYYVDTETLVSNPWNRAYNEILNPRVMRLGVRFEF
jgi:hypothetical protein